MNQLAVVLEQHKVAHIVEQDLGGQGTAHQGLQFIELAKMVELDAVDGAPLQKAFGVGRQGAHTGLGAVADEQHFLVLFVPCRSESGRTFESSESVG